MNLVLNQTVLKSSNTNYTVNHYFSNLFIDQWSVDTNYSTYFQLCAPSFCTYMATDRTDLSRAITLFISLYGGLIFIFRLICPFLIDIIMQITCVIKINRHNRMLDLTNTIPVDKFIQWLTKFNLFKRADERAPDKIRQQKITTCFYMILLSSTYPILQLSAKWSVSIIEIGLLPVDFERSFSF